MPSIGTIATSLFGLALLTFSAAQEATTADWVKAELSDTDTNLLKAALGTVRGYDPSVTVLICASGVESVATQDVMVENRNESNSGHNYNFDSQSGTNYKFSVYGCPVELKQDVGYCPDQAGCSDAGLYNVMIFSQPKTDTLKVTSVTRHNRIDD